MLLDDTRGEQEAYYACQSRCPTPRLHALRAEVMLVRTVLRTVLTEENISRVLAAVNAPQWYDAAHEHSLTWKDVQEPGEDPERLVLAADSTRESRDLLGTIVAEIQVDTKRAVIRYALPLPEDSPLVLQRRVIPQGNSWADFEAGDERVRVSHDERSVAEEEDLSMFSHNASL